MDMQVFERWVGLLFGALLLVALLALGATTLSAQASLSGVVVDHSTGAPIAAATVRLIRDGETLQGVSTDADGAFSFVIVGLEPVQLEVERIGYRTTRSEGIGLTVGLALEVQFRMRPDAIEMDPILVTGLDRSGAGEFARRRDQWGRGQFFDPEQIAAMDLQMTADFFRHADGLMMTWGRGGNGFGAHTAVPNVRVFSGRGCLNYMVDWQPALPDRWGGHIWATGLLGMLEPEDVRAVEIYRNPSEVPEPIRRYVNQSWVEFADGEVGFRRMERDLCGLVVIWTEQGWGASMG